MRVKAATDCAISRGSPIAKSRGPQKITKGKSKPVATRTTKRAVLKCSAALAKVERDASYSRAATSP